MGTDTKIEWADHSWSPWVGCSHVSEGCEHCYAEAMGRRFGVAWGESAPRRLTADGGWQSPPAWNRRAAKEGRRARVFCSMCDPFDPAADPAWRARFYDMIHATPHLDWMLLTKRPELIGRAYPPPEHCWVGVSIESPRYVDRIRQLRERWNGRRFISVEPLLAEIDLPIDGIDWVIVGCESGPRARPCELDWIRRIRDKCEAAGVPLFVKAARIEGMLVRVPAIDGRVWSEIPRSLSSIFIPPKKEEKS